jgi:uncharacterized protein YcnI
MKNLAALLLLGLPVAAAGHVVLAPDTSPAGAYYAGVLRVGHGCDGAATTELHVTIPAAAKDAKPQPKPGWTVTVERDSGRVTGLRWTGLLPAEQFDSFGIMLVLDPAVTGTVYLPVVQRCGDTEKRWTQIPESGAAWTSVPSPAPRLIVSPAMPEQHSNH